MTDTIIVLGKRSVRKTEVPHLETFGKAMHARSKQLITTKTEGVASIVAKAYAAAGGTPQYLSKKDYATLIEEHPVVAFTDTKYQEQLDTIHPGWKTAGWVIIHNPKATEEAAAFLVNLLDEFGTPIGASA